MTNKSKTFHFASVADFVFVHGTILISFDSDGFVVGGGNSSISILNKMNYIKIL